MDPRAHALTFNESCVQDEERNWAIHACAHGCVHMALGCLTVTLTSDEFRALLMLMGKAHRQFHAPAALPLWSH